MRPRTHARLNPLILPPPAHQFRHKHVDPLRKDFYPAPAVRPPTTIEYVARWAA